MRGLDPRIHAELPQRKTLPMIANGPWIAGSSPAMTWE
jgi:hypothetical protein